jgi:hypothetical protein
MQQPGKNFIFGFRFWFQLQLQFPYATSFGIWLCSLFVGTKIANILALAEIMIYL